MARHAWVIEKDHLDGETPRSVQGLSGPSEATDALIGRLTAGEGRRFRMFDDDGELYFEGRCVSTDLDDANLGEEFFGPLDDYGMGGAGCTSIQYLITGKWVQL